MSQHQFGSCVPAVRGQHRAGSATAGHTPAAATHATSARANATHKQACTSTKLIRQGRPHLRGVASLMRQRHADTATPLPASLGGQKGPQRAARRSLRGRAAPSEGIVRGGRTQEGRRRRRSAWGAAAQGLLGNSFASGVTTARQSGSWAGGGTQPAHWSLSRRSCARLLRPCCQLAAAACVVCHLRVRWPQYICHVHTASACCPCICLEELGMPVAPWIVRNVVPNLRRRTCAHGGSLDDQLQTESALKVQYTTPVTHAPDAMGAVCISYLVGSGVMNSIIVTCQTGMLPR